MASNVLAGGLDSLRQYRVAVYSSLAKDTTGTDLLPTTIVDKYIHIAVDQMSAWALGEEVRKLIVMTDLTPQYFLDTNVTQIKSIAKIDSGQYLPLKVRDPSEFQDILPTTFDEVTVKDYVPQLAALFLDSVRIYPTPKYDLLDNNLDTLQVSYWRRPVDDGTLITMMSIYQYGIVLHARWQCEIRLNRGKDKSALDDYIAWVGRVNATMNSKLTNKLRDE